jgi:hypothetical protein
LEKALDVVKIGPRLTILSMQSIMFQHLIGTEEKKIKQHFEKIFHYKFITNLSHRALRFASFQKAATWVHYVLL